MCQIKKNTYTDKNYIWPHKTQITVTSIFEKKKSIFHDDKDYSHFLNEII